jgi:hypothetical protein
MNRILAKRYAFCNFSNIVGFPNQVPSRDEWENSLPRFHGEEWEVPAEHLLDFHEFIDRLEIVHEDVKIKLFKFSLEGIGLDWCRSLPDASINSLAEFHSAFHVFCKDYFSVDLLFPDCCHEFNLSKSELQGEYAAEENTLHHDQEIIDSPHDNFSDAFDIMSNASTDVCCHEDKIVPSEKFEDVEQNDISASDIFRSVKLEEDSLQFPDLQFKEDSSQLACLLIEERFQENPQPTFDRETNELSQQQIQKVFCYDFEDPFADFLESMSSIDLKIFLPEEDYPLFKPFFCMIRLLLLFKSRSRMLPVNKFLTWLHWKHEFT